MQGPPIASATKRCVLSVNRTLATKQMAPSRVTAAAKRKIDRSLRSREGTEIRATAASAQGIAFSKPLTLELDGVSTRYRLLDTTKAYPIQKLADCDEALGTARRHANYVQQVLETPMVEASGGGQAPRAQERASLLADARAASTWVYANDDGADLRVPLAGACARLFVELIC